MYAKDFDYAIHLPADDYPLGPIVRVHGCHIDKYGDKNGSAFRRNSWVKISTDNGKPIYRQIRGGGFAGLKQAAIAIDYDGRIDLNLRDDGDVRESPKGIREYHPYQGGKMHVRQIHLAELPVALCNHRDYGYRASMRVAVVALLITIVSLIISMLSIVF